MNRAILKLRFQGPDRAQRVLDLVAAIAIPLVAGAAGLVAFLLVGGFAAVIAGVTVLALLGLAVIPFRVFVGELESQLRGAQRPPTYDVFVSYRLRQHADLVPDLTEALQAHGLKVWLDTRAIGSADKNFNLGPLALVKGSLNEQLSTALQESRAVLFLLPQDSMSPPLSFSWFRDPRSGRIGLLHVLLHLHPLAMVIAAKNLAVDGAQRVWYRTFYGVSLHRHRGEAWQAWEARVGSEMGRQVTVAAIIPADELPPDADHSRCIRRTCLRDDVRERIVPKIVEAPEHQRQLSFLPGLQKKFANVVVAIGVGALILLAVAFVVGALETIGVAIRTPVGISLLIGVLVAAALLLLW